MKLSQVSKLRMPQSDAGNMNDIDIAEGETGSESESGNSALAEVPAEELVSELHKRGIINSKMASQLAKYC